MTCSREKRSQLAERLISCRHCGGVASVAFGPYGFMTACRACGQCEHLDEMMEPVWFAPVVNFLAPIPAKTVAIVKAGPHEIAVMPKESRELVAVA